MRISPRNEPSPDEKARKGNSRVMEIHLDHAKLKQIVQKNLCVLTVINHGFLFVVIIFQGFNICEFRLDTWIMISLITGVMGSTTAYFLKRSTDFAHSKQG